ncbi:MAG TPA: hypothetical protein VFB72_16600 [Verrucomicrobiae bacterium]|nr:hypothetical protein [Verrucomicrobiae bacterium]
MASKFGHERANRRDKVLRGSGGCLGGNEPPGLWKFIITPDHKVRCILNHQVADRLERVELMQSFESAIQNCRFKVLDWKFSFAWDVARFAKANNLSLSKASAPFENVRKEASERLRIVKQRMRKDGFRINYEKNESGNWLKVLALDCSELGNFFQMADKD